MKKNKILLAVILVIILGLLIKYRYNIGKYLGIKERFKAAKEIRTFYLYKGTNKNKVYFDSDNKRLVTNSQKNLSVKDLPLENPNLIYYAYPRYHGRDSEEMQVPFIIHKKTDFNLYNKIKVVKLRDNYMIKVNYNSSLQYRLSNHNDQCYMIC